MFLEGFRNTRGRLLMQYFIIREFNSSEKNLRNYNAGLRPTTTFKVFVWQGGLGNNLFSETAL